MKKKGMILVMAILLSAVNVLAEQKEAIELRNIAEVEVVKQNDKGVKEVSRVEAGKANVVPGDTVIYTITFVNHGDQPATDVVLTDPVPDNMEYVEGSAEGAGTLIRFSVDNGRTYGPFESLKVVADGKERPARVADITHIRWIVEKLEKGAQGSVSFRAKVK